MASATAALWAAVCLQSHRGRSSPSKEVEEAQSSAFLWVWSFKAQRHTHLSNLVALSHSLPSAEQQARE